MEYRLIPLSIATAAENMATDEAILRSVGRGDSPSTLRFYRWRPSAVSLGCFQSFEYEIDEEQASQNNVDIVRRISGGGAVFHDSYGELTYSFVSKLEEVPTDIIESFKKICNGLVGGFRVLGLDANYSEVNDVLVNDKKISGSAQTRRYGAVLQHGTILIDPDIRLMFRLLKVSPEKITDKFVSSVYKRVTSIFRELENRPSFTEVRDAMVTGFEREFGAEISFGELTEGERGLVKSLKDRYASEDWIRKR